MEGDWRGSKTDPGLVWTTFIRQTVNITDEITGVTGAKPYKKQLHQLCSILLLSPQDIICES